MPEGTDVTLNSRLLTALNSRQGQLPAAPSQSSSAGSRLGGVVKGLISPLVDVPELPGGRLGDFVERALEEISTPASLFAVGLAPFTGGASIAGTSAAGRLVSALALEATIGTTAGYAAEQVAHRLPDSTPEGLRLATALLAAVGTGVGASKALTASGIATGARKSVTEQAAFKNLTDAATAQEELVTPLDRIVFALRNSETKDVRATTDKVRRVQRGTRANEALKRREQVFAETGDVVEAQEAGLGALKGSLASSSFKLPENVVSDADWDVVLREVQSSPKLQLFEQSDAFKAVAGLMDGKLPTDYEMGLLRGVLGREFTEAVTSLQQKPGLFRQVMLSTNIMRAVQASMDLSGMLRQGGSLGVTNPRGYLKSVKPMLHALSDEDYARQYLDNIFEDASTIKVVQNGAEVDYPIAALRRKGGLDITDIDSKLNVSEEQFLSTGMDTAINDLFSKTLAGKTVAATERAYVTFLDGLRADTFKRMIDQYEGLPLNVVESRAGRLAEFINASTGRKQLPKALGGNSSLMNALFFAPRFVYSRFTLPVDMIRVMPKSTVDESLRILKSNANPAAAMKQIRANPELAADWNNVWKANRGLVGFVGAGLTAGALMKAGGLADIEMNPTASDFGKVRVGSTRYDFWLGYQQIARTAARLAQGQRNTASGRDVDINRLEEVWRYLRAKASPVAGLGTDILAGETFLGEEVSPNVKSVADQATSRLLPLIVQDIQEAFDEEGFVGGLKASPAALGLSTQAYSSTRDVQNNVAQELFDKPYSDLTPSEQATVKVNPTVVDKVQELDLLAGETYGSTIADVNAFRIESERVMASAFAAGNFSPKDLADSVGGLQLRVAGRRQQALDDFNVEFAPPSSPLRQALSGYYDLYRQADVGSAAGLETGVIDWALFDDLENAYRQRLSAAEKAFVDDRVGTEHDPTLDFFFEAKDSVRTSGYYETLDNAFDRLRNSARNVVPDATSYSDLLAAYNRAVLAEDVRSQRSIERVVKRIQDISSRERGRLRRRNPDLDASLFLLGRTSTFTTGKAERIVSETFSGLLDRFAE